MMESKNNDQQKPKVVILTMAKESEITSIRIPKSVKDELDDVALEKESYHVTIQRLIRENKHLKKENKRYDVLFKTMLDKIDEIEKTTTWEDAKEDY